MKIDQLIDKMQENNIPLPKNGTGKNGKILARDLETQLGNSFAREKYPDPSDQLHLRLRQQTIPQKAYRYNNLPDNLQKEVFDRDNDWVLEPKFNGWRMIITFVPGSGFRFWGGNISDVDFLPVDYTDHILLDDRHPLEFGEYYPDTFIMDAEAVCYDSVEMLDGRQSTNTLDAVKAILGSGPERAIEKQKIEGHTLIFHCFDHITVIENRPMYQDCFDDRKRALYETIFSTYLSQFSYVVGHQTQKRQKLREIWSGGGEGAIIKHLDSPYVPGSRRKDIAIKVKRTMSREIGDDIDAFIAGWHQTKEWSKKGRIGGVHLAVYIEDIPTVIATVTNIPDALRDEFTLYPDKYLNRVVVVDGQELSARNRKIMHATVDWDRGFRETKRKADCTFTFKHLETERF